MAHLTFHVSHTWEEVVSGDTDRGIAKDTTEGEPTEVFPKSFHEITL